VTSRTHRHFWTHFDRLPEEVRTRAREKYRLWQRASLPKVSVAEISDLISKINQLGRRIGHIVQNVDKSFVPAISNDSWVWRLIETLKKATKTRVRYNY
jgi:hypothetical protein